MIKRFYAVTAYNGNKAPKSASVYEVRIENNEAIVQKIALKGKSSLKVGDRLDKGSVVAVSHSSGLQRYTPHKGLRMDDVNTINFGGGSAPIVALFSRIDSAIRCLQKEELKNWDKRFKKSTEKVLRKIGVQTTELVRLDHRLFVAVNENKISEYLYN